MTSKQVATGTADTVTWVKELTVIRRIRRALAKKNHTLLITREGTHARRDLGLYAVLDADQEVIERNADLANLARFLGVLAPLEMIDPPLGRGWKHYVARQVTVEVDGVPCLYNEPVTRVYSTPEAARRAAEGIEDRTGLVLCGFDSRQGGRS